VRGRAVLSITLPRKSELNLDFLVNDPAHVPDWAQTAVTGNPHW
jgi:hypothetical protein